MDTPHSPPRNTVRRPRRSLVRVSGARWPPGPVPQYDWRARLDLPLQLRHRAELCALSTALADRRVSRHARSSSAGLERIGLAAGALGALGFVASCLGVASGQLDTETYLALSVSSLAQYAVALVLVHRASHRASR